MVERDADGPRLGRGRLDGPARVLRVPPAVARLAGVLGLGRWCWRDATAGDRERYWREIDAAYGAILRGEAPEERDGRHGHQAAGRPSPDG